METKEMNNGTISWKQLGLAGIYEALQNSDFMLTPKRQEVIQFIYKNDVLDDIEESWLELRKHYAISWATMYGTVRELAKLGWLQVDRSQRRRKYIVKKTN